MADVGDAEEESIKDNEKMLYKNLKSIGEGLKNYLAEHGGEVSDQSMKEMEQEVSTQVEALLQGVVKNELQAKADSVALAKSMEIEAVVEDEEEKGVQDKNIRQDVKEIERIEINQMKKDIDLAALNVDEELKFRVAEIENLVIQKTLAKKLKQHEDSNTDGEEDKEGEEEKKEDANNTEDKEDKDVEEENKEGDNNTDGEEDKEGEEEKKEDANNTEDKEDKDAEEENKEGDNNTDGEEENKEGDNNTDGEEDKEGEEETKEDDNKTEDEEDKEVEEENKEGDNNTEDKEDKEAEAVNEEGDNNTVEGEKKEDDSEEDNNTDEEEEEEGQ
jgi:hypothetical protein